MGNTLSRVTPRGAAPKRVPTTSASSSYAPKPSHHTFTPPSPSPPTSTPLSSSSLKVDKHANGKPPTPLINFNIIASRTAEDEDNSRVIYTSQEDYEMMKAMEAMSSEERREFEEAMDRMYREEYERLQTDSAFDEFNTSRMASSSSGGGGNGSGSGGTLSPALPRATMEFLKQQQEVKRMALEEQQRQEKLLEEFSPDDVERGKDDELVKRVSMLAANIKQVDITHKIVGEMPEYMKGLKAKAKPSALVDDTDEDLSQQQQQKMEGGGSSRRTRVTREEHRGQRFNIYDPFDISGVFSTKQLTLALDHIRDRNTRQFDQLDERGNSPLANEYIDSFCEKHEVEREELLSIMKYINTPYVLSLDNNTAYGLWHSPDFAAAVRRSNAMKRFDGTPHNNDKKATQ